MQLAQELERVSQVLAGRLQGGISLMAAATLEGAAPVGAPSTVHQVTTFDRNDVHRLPARQRPPVDAVTAVGEETGCGRGAHGRRRM